jgi:hypothetical protein
MTSLRVLAGLSLTLFVVAPACGGDDTTEQKPVACDVAAQTGCTTPGTVCEEVQGAEPACYAPLLLKGKVFDSVAADQHGIANARVVARDANDTAVSTVAITAADGTYSLNVPAPRDANGVPVKVQYTLRADASGYDTFPKAPRIALPIDISEAAGTPLVLQNAATDIGLIPIPNASGNGFISGKVTGDVVSATDGSKILPGGMLVVANGVTGVVDKAGNFVVYNVPAATGIEVHGYAQGIQVTPATVTVTAGKETAGVELKTAGEATATISGNIQIVNATGGATTSVILVVEETFEPNAARGEAPRGLRVGDVSGAFSINGVPDGNYVVLAAFENDGLVRDPDTSIGGTEIVHITVAGMSQELAEGFKVTGALAVTSPGAEKLDEVSGTPTFVFEDDSSEDTYEVRVFDALGELVWEDLAVPGQSGSGDVSVDYGGDPLTPGMIYQFRATSIKDTVPISATEDLKGVFIYK